MKAIRSKLTPTLLQEQEGGSLTIYLALPTMTAITSLAMSLSYNANNLECLSSFVNMYRTI